MSTIMKSTDTYYQSLSLETYKAGHRIETFVDHNSTLSRAKKFSDPYRNAPQTNTYLNPYGAAQVS